MIGPAARVFLFVYAYGVAALSFYAASQQYTPVWVITPLVLTWLIAIALLNRQVRS